MNPDAHNRLSAAIVRLHALRMANDETRFAMDDMRPRFESLRSRHENGTAPRAVSAFQLFQTPPALATRLIALAELSAGLSVLEPSAGLGRLIAPALAAGVAERDVTACEVDAALAGELFAAFPGIAALWQGDFLARPAAPVFDRVVMNPPFHMRADVRHTLHALAMLKPGGVLVGLCLATHHRETALRPLCNHWETIPAGAFAAEGTKVGTILFRVQKD